MTRAHSGMGLYEAVLQSVAEIGGCDTYTAWWAGRLASVNVPLEPRSEHEASHSEEL